MQQVEEMVVENQKLFDQQNIGIWLIQTRANLEVIGFVGLWYFFDEAQPQLIYALRPAATQKGYATEAASKIVDYCFNTLGYGYLIASANKPNLTSHHVAQRLGMKLVEERSVEGQPLLFFRLEKPQ
jgi:ribosomal-protein-alanine N-acetyltransferase